jgi:hypothetical protein
LQLPIARAARSDKEGRYELRGHGKRTAGYRVKFVPAAQLYFNRSVTFPDMPGLDLVQGDIDIMSGILTKGKVTHKVTEKPLAGVQADYNPLYPNPYIRWLGSEGAGMTPCSAATPGHPKPHDQ